MKHQFFGGPLDKKVILLDTVLADQDLKERIPWEEYERVYSGSTEDNVLQLVQWRYRSEPSTVVPEPETPVVKEHTIRQGEDGRGYDIVKAVLEERNEPQPVKTVVDINDLSYQDALDRESMRAALNTPPLPGSIANTQVPSPAPEKPAKRTTPEAQVNNRPAEEPASVDPVTIGDEVWRTFEERRKKLRIPRGKFGTELGLTTSFGWRLESGNVSKNDVKKLELSSTDEVYARADAYLRGLENA